MEHVIVMVLLGVLAATAVAVIRLRNLYTIVMLFAVYSLLSASVFLIMDAGDVAFTEAAVGAGITTVLMLSTVSLTGASLKSSRRNPLVAVVMVVLTGLALVWGTLDLPGYGDADAPIHRHVAPRYIEDSPEEIGIPNTVASVLASYRGFDTFGEVTVVFTAGLGVLLLLGARKRKDGPRP
jgi:multicomponent Na+:H+ antiporter subunit B